MPYVLDTDVISALLRNNSTVVSRVGAVDSSDVFVTIVSLAEQSAGRLSALNKGQLTDERLIEAYLRLRQTLDFFAAANILPFL